MPEEIDDLAVSEDELTALKQRATAMGVTFHPNIGLDTLRERVSNALTAKNDPDEAGKTASVTPITESLSQKRNRLKQEANRLVLVRITCMNPNRSEADGEIFTAGNSLVGSFRNMVPFNVPWHVPQIILNVINARKCQVFTTVKRGGQEVREGKLVKEFAVEVLPPLTHEELVKLAQRQAMANGTAAA
jgi:hypothetical protein